MISSSIPSDVRASLIGKCLSTPDGRVPLLQSMVQPLDVMERIVGVGDMTARMEELEEILVLTRMLHGCEIFQAAEMAERAAILARKWRDIVEPVTDVMSL